MDYDHKRLLIKAARLYYEQDMTQTENQRAPAYLALEGSTNSR